MSHAETAYALWLLVFFNAAIFILFGYSFFKPATARDRRTFGLSPYGLVAVATDCCSNNEPKFGLDGR